MNARYLIVILVRWFPYADLSWSLNLESERFFLGKLEPGAG